MIPTMKASAVRSYYWVLAIAALVLFTSVSGANDPTVAASLGEIYHLRLAGELDEARSKAEQRLLLIADREDRIATHLELFRIYDRIGLHNNTRPVRESLEHVNAAADLLSLDNAKLSAQVQLAYGDYYYRAEMNERDFPLATQHVTTAIEQFRTVGELHGEADAVHRLGLIHLQRRELAAARNLFDESLKLDQRGGERTWFRGEYERHVGFVYQFSADLQGALPHYERSLQARIEARAIDASLFAALTLSSTLSQLNRSAEALRYADYALCVALGIDSPVGIERAENLLANISGSRPAVVQEPITSQDNVSSSLTCSLD